MLRGTRAEHVLYMIVELSFVFLIGATAADTTTSAWNNRCLNLVETNGFVANPDGTMHVPKAIAYKVAFTLPDLFAMRALAKAGHPRVAALVGVLAGAYPAYLAVHNARLPCEGRR